MSYSKTFKEKVISEFIKLRKKGLICKNVNEIIRDKYHVTRQTLYRWSKMRSHIKQYNKPCDN